MKFEKKVEEELSFKITFTGIIDGNTSEPSSLLRLEGILHPSNPRYSLSDFLAFHSKIDFNKSGTTLMCRNVEGEICAIKADNTYQNLFELLKEYRKSRTERFKEASRKLMTFVIKDKKIDPFSGTNQVSFRLPNAESDSLNVFEYSKSEEFIEDLQSLDLSSPFDKTAESAIRILNALGIDQNRPFALEMHR